MSAVLRHAGVLLVAGMLLTGALQAQRRTTRGAPLEPVRLGPHIGYSWRLQFQVALTSLDSRAPRPYLFQTLFSTGATA